MQSPRMQRQKLRGSERALADAKNQTKSLHWSLFRSCLALIQSKKNTSSWIFFTFNSSFSGEREFYPATKWNLEDALFFLCRFRFVGILEAAPRICHVQGEGKRNGVCCNEKQVSDNPLLSLLSFPCFTRWHNILAFHASHVYFLFVVGFFKQRFFSLFLFHPINSSPKSRMWKSRGFFGRKIRPRGQHQLTLLLAEVGKSSAKKINSMMMHWSQMLVTAVDAGIKILLQPYTRATTHGQSTAIANLIIFINGKPGEEWWHGRSRHGSQRHRLRGFSP